MKESQKATAEQLIEYAKRCQSRLETRSFNDYIASIHGKDEGTVTADLQGADLRKANLRRADLRGVDLQGAALQEANLYGASLQGAKLRWANLYLADLQRADLQQADLQEAKLRWANLYLADLNGAKLQGTDLQGANLYLADLHGANLRGADLRRAKLLAVNLQGAYLANAILVDTENLPALSKEQHRQAIVTNKQLDAAVDRLIIDPSLSLLDYNMPGMYDAAKPETKAKLEAAFPRLQWDKPLEVQLQAAQTLALLIGIRELAQQQLNAASYQDEIVAFNSEYSAIKPLLNKGQLDAIWSVALNVTPGKGFSGHETARYLLAENGTPELRAEANKERAITSFIKNFAQKGSLKNEGPQNWVEKASYTRQAEWQLGG